MSKGLKSTFWVLYMAFLVVVVGFVIKEEVMGNPEAYAESRQMTYGTKATENVGKETTGTIEYVKNEGSVAEKNNLLLEPTSINGFSRNCYNETLALVDKFFSESFKKEISQIYINFGKSTYDSDITKEKIKQVENRIRNDYYDVYSKYESEKDREMVLWAYNYSLLCLLEYRGRGMNVQDCYYDEVLQKYYDLFNTNPTIEIFDDFCLYLTKNNVMDYKTVLKKRSLSELADYLGAYCSLADTNFMITSYYLNNRDMVSAYDSYCIAMDSFRSIVESLNEYPEYSSQFTDDNLKKISMTIEDSEKCCKNFVNSYSANSSDNVVYYGERFEEYVTILDDFLEEVTTNSEKLSEQ